MRFQSDKERTAFGRAAVVGIEFAGVVVGCLVAGWWLDQKLDTEPGFTFGGLILGSFTGFRILWKLAKSTGEDTDG